MVSRKDHELQTGSDGYIEPCVFPERNLLISLFFSFRRIYQPHCSPDEKFTSPYCYPGCPIISMKEPYERIKGKSTSGQPEYQLSEPVDLSQSADKRRRIR